MKDNRRLTDEELYEIREMYRLARNKRTQIRIMRDLYVISTEHLLEVLGLDEMPKDKDKHGKWRIPDTVKMAAARDVTENGMTHLAAAQKHGISLSTLDKWMEGMQ